MPLIRRDPPAPAENGQPGPGDLKSGDADTRRRAVRALGQRPQAVPILMDALGRESDPAVIEAIFTALEAIPEAVLPLAPAPDAAALKRATAAVKLQAVRAYATQFPATKAGIFGAIETMNRYHGLTAGFEAGEIFMTYRSVGIDDLMRWASPSHARS